VQRLHAKGGLGEVFIAHDVELSRDVALKEIQPQFADNPQSRSRFLFEARITGRLEHPGIVPVYSLGQYADGSPYYAMRFVDGESLQNAVERFHLTYPERDAFLSGEGGVEFRQLLGRFVAVCHAIEYAHKHGVIHRDLKPANIMLGRYGETLIVDWGLAKLLEQSESSQAGHDLDSSPSMPDHGFAETLDGSVLGTPAYMSPEQAAGQVDKLGAHSDVYGLGATMYHLLTGQPPFTGTDRAEVLRRIQLGDLTDPTSVNRSIPRLLEAICLKALELRPHDRYSSARQLADDIDHWLADEPITAFREGIAARLQRWSRRHRHWVRALAASALITVVTVASGWVLMRNRESKHLRERSEYLVAMSARLENENKRIVQERNRVQEQLTDFFWEKKSFHSSRDDDLELAIKSLGYDHAYFYRWRNADLTGWVQFDSDDGVRRVPLNISVESQKSSKPLFWRSSYEGVPFSGWTLVAMRRNPKMSGEAYDVWVEQQFAIPAENGTQFYRGPSAQGKVRGVRGAGLLAREGSLVQLGWARDGGSEAWFELQFDDLKGREKQ
jgi:serine/threonine protein kinase